MIDEASPMPEVIAGLKRAEYAACHEFCRRQRPDLLETLRAGADRLGEIVFDLECRQPGALLAWKFPEAYEPVEIFPDVLDAACEDRESDIYAMLADAPFPDLAATASACAHIKSAVLQIKRYGHQAPDPQQALL